MNMKEYLAWRQSFQRQSHGSPLSPLEPVRPVGCILRAMPAQATSKPEPGKSFAELLSKALINNDKK